MPYASGEEAAWKLGLRSGNISGCCNGKRKTAGNYEFRWGEPLEVAIMEGEVWRDVVLKEIE